jgi:2-polyprenyl-3-methyl-5-hydroxy-6-metoxy-1,4-benzoquinol methylase
MIAIEREPAVELACWCSRGRWAVCFRKKTFGLLRCSGCGTYRIDPPAVAGDSDLSRFYTSYYEGPKSPLHAAKRPVRRQSRFWKVVEHVGELDRVGSNALDIGCGDGSLCSELRAAGWPSVAGIDVSRSRIARARQLHHGIDFYDLPLERTRVAPGSLDLVILDNVIEHVPAPLVELQRIRPYLRAGARVVLITPNMESGNFRLLGSRWTPELAPHVHIFLFTVQSLTALAESAGYGVEHSGAFHLDPVPARRLIARFVSGDVKGAVWKAYQEAGSVYSRLIESGPMLYIVASPKGINGKLD